MSDKIDEMRHILGHCTGSHSCWYTDATKRLKDDFPHDDHTQEMALGNLQEKAIQQLIDDAVREARVGSVLGTMRQADAAMQAQFILSLFYSWCMKETNAAQATLSTEIDHNGGRAKLKVVAQLQTKDSNNNNTEEESRKQI